MNWGTRVVIGFLAGVVFISYFVVRSMLLTTEMAEDNYYEKELVFNQRLVATENGKKAISAFVFDADATAVKFKVDSTLSANWDSATLHFYCPAAQSKDKTIPLLASSSGQFLVSTKAVGKGHFVLKLQFKSQQKKYYKEQTLFLP